MSRWQDKTHGGWKMQRRMKHTCCWCGRTASGCWTLPCLSLQTALETGDHQKLRRWAKAANVKLQKKTTGEVLG